jgi:hypothetical protein
MMMNRSRVLHVIGPQSDCEAGAADAISGDALSNGKAFTEVPKNCTARHTQFRKPLS